MAAGSGKLRTSTTARLQPRAFQAQIRRYCSMQCILMHTGTLSCMWHTRRPAASCSSVFPIDIDSALNRTHRHTVHTASAPPEALRLAPLAGHASLAQALTNCRLRCPCRLQAQARAHGNSLRQARRPSWPRLFGSCSRCSYCRRRYAMLYANAARMGRAGHRVHRYHPYTGAPQAKKNLAVYAVSCNCNGRSHWW